MRLFFTKKELKLRKKRVIMMIACMTVLLAGYLILTWPKKIQPELPTVIVEPPKWVMWKFLVSMRSYTCTTVCGSPCTCGRLFGEYAFCRRDVYN